jgi:molybdate/tungstate transport system permease protein
VKRIAWLRGKSPFIAVSAFTGSILLLFLLGPILSTLISSTSGIPGALNDNRIIEAINMSITCASVATLLILVTGVPLAYVLTRYEFKGRSLVDSVLDLPILIPHNAAGIAILFFFSSRSIVGGIFNRVGLSFVDTALGVIVAMAFVSAPFMVRNAEEAFRAVDPSMERVARSLGAGPMEAFRYVSLPLSLRGIFTGTVLTWARAVSEFGAVVVLAYYPKTAPVLLFDVLIGEGLQKALPITGILLIIGAVMFTAFRVLSRGQSVE